MKERFTLDDIFSQGDAYAILFRRFRDGKHEYDWALSRWIGGWEDCTSPNHRAEKMISRGWKAIEFVRLTGDDK